MDTFEVEKTETVGRKEAATQLRRIANLLSSEDDAIGFERDGMQFSIHVPDQIRLKVELEIGPDERGVELDIELQW
ncbi:MAG: amphi-Trp domain-containing protein [Actinobacteria bacterium]|nr:amphi-Trp domain-containing protein [Actinomycetota bacterium]